MAKHTLKILRCTAGFLAYVWPFFNIMNERVNNRGLSLVTAIPHCEKSYQRVCSNLLKTFVRETFLHEVYEQNTMYCTYCSQIKRHTEQKKMLFS